MNYKVSLVLVVGVLSRTPDGQTTRAPVSTSTWAEADGPSSPSTTSAIQSHTLGEHAGSIRPVTIVADPGALDGGVAFNEFMQFLDPSGPAAVSAGALEDLIAEIETSEDVNAAVFESLGSSILFNVASEASLRPPVEVWNAFFGDRILIVAREDPTKRQHIVMPLVQLAANLGLDDAEVGTFMETSGLGDFCYRNMELIREVILEDHRINWKFRRMVRPAPDSQTLYQMISRQSFLADFVRLCPLIFAQGAAETRMIAFMHHIQQTRLHLAYGGLEPEVLSDIDRNHAFISWFTRRKRLGSPIGIGSVQFRNEIGSGAGVVRDWFREAAREIFNETYGLFNFNSDGYYILNTTGIRDRPRWRSELRSVGSFIAFAIAEQIPLGVHLPISLLSFLTGSPMNLVDLQVEDPGMWSGLTALLPMTQAQLDETALFYYNDGVEERLTIDNRDEFIRQKINSLIPQTSPYHILRLGFRRVIPVLPHFVSPRDLSQALVGESELRIDDLLRELRLYGYDQSSEQVSWLIRLLRSFTQDNIRRFLAFVTGTPFVPLGGFASLQYPILIIKSSEPDTHLPRSRTCFHHFFLPEYSTEQVLNEKVLQAISLDGSMGLV
jgi:hypothetical protein